MLHCKHRAHSDMTGHTCQNSQELAGIPFETPAEGDFLGKTDLNTQIENLPAQTF